MPFLSDYPRPWRRAGNRIVDAAGAAVPLFTESPWHNEPEHLKEPEIEWLLLRVNAPEQIVPPVLRVYEPKKNGGHNGRRRR